MNALEGPPAHEVPVEQARAGHEQETAQLSGPGDEVAEVRDVELPGAVPIPVRIYRPLEPAGGVLAYFHGGGWAVGSIDSFDTVCRALANESGAIVASVGYRLAPEHRFPAALEDCAAATRGLAERFPGEPLAVAGDSAGGNLALGVARRLRDQLRAQALIYPVCDAGLNTPSYRDFKERYGLSAEGMQRYWNLYLDGSDGLQPDASPLRADDLEGLPPTFVLTSEFDVLRDEGEAMAEKLREAGVDVTLRRYDGTIHGFWRWLATTDIARGAIAEVGAALRRDLA
ncbi:MAG: alpha/beta hydrolase [Solirubrobacteraceae bacterium]